MEPTVLSVLHTFSAATRIPVSVISGGVLQAHFPEDDNDLNLPMLLSADLPSERPMLWQSCLLDDLLFGGIRLDDGTDLFIGPVLPYACTEQMARRILHLIGRTSKDIAPLHRHFYLCSTQTEETLGRSLTLLAMLLVLPATAPENIGWQQTPDLPYEPAYLSEEVDPGTSTENLEKELLSYIRHGQVHPLEEAMRRIPRVSEDPSLTVPLYRYYILMALTIASRAAIEGGVDYNRAIYLLHTCMEQIADPRHNPDSLYQDVYIQYAKMTAAVQSAAVGDPLCAAITAYIKNHVQERLNPRVLAAALGYTPSYLCAHFKKVTGQTISQHVHRAKADEAKRLLLLGSTSCQEIAEQLSYPSQAAFTDAFRRVTGLSPTAWLRDQRESEQN